MKGRAIPIRAVALATPMLALAATHAPRSRRVAPPPCAPGSATELVIASTTDTHGRIRGWDYYANRPDSTTGLTRAATIIDSLRAANPGHVIVVDAGDNLEGNPFATTVRKRGGPNAIVASMNAIGYDAGAVGNHEFNYGVPYLDSAIAQARFPILGANVARRTGRVFPGAVTVRRGGLRVAIVGATTPGSNIWDREHLRAANIHVDDIVPAVRARVTAARRGGANAVVVVMHSGLDGPPSYDTVATGVANENVARRVAETVPGIDLIVYGHTHRENAGQVIGTTRLVQPKNWATSVSVATLPFTCVGGRWTAGTSRSTIVRTVGHAESPRMLAASARAHDATVRTVTTPIATTPDSWSAESGRREDTPLADFILEVEREATHADIASTAVFDTRLHFGPGAITEAAMAQLYPYDNTLRAIRITGAQLRAYLEQSARYYVTTRDGALVPDTAVAGYNFDVVSGVEYTLDVTRPVGERVTSLTWHGRPVQRTDSFVMAINNYRQSGGGGYSMVANAPVVYDRNESIRDLLIAAARRRGTLRTADFFVRNWSFSPARPTP